MHPDLDATTVQAAPSPSGIADHLGDVHVTDERYSFLELVAPEPLNPHLTHRHAGVVHPLAWARQVGERGARVVYDALGHDVRSYASPSRRALLAAEVAWLMGRQGARDQRALPPHRDRSALARAGRGAQPAEARGIGRSGARSGG